MRFLFFVKRKCIVMAENTRKNILGAKEKMLQSWLKSIQETKKEIAGDDSELADVEGTNADPQAQDRDIASETIEEEQGEPVEKEVEVDEKKEATE